MPKYYVIFIWCDVEPTTHGPYDSPEQRDVKALELRREDSDESGIYPAKTDEAGVLHVGTYSGAFFDEVDNDEN